MYRFYVYIRPHTVTLNFCWAQIDSFIPYLWVSSTKSALTPLCQRPVRWVHSVVHREYLGAPLRSAPLAPCAQCWCRSGKTRFPSITMSEVSGIVLLESGYVIRKIVFSKTRLIQLHGNYSLSNRAVTPSTSPHFTSPLTSRHFTSPHITLLQITSLHFSSLHFISPH